MAADSISTVKAHNHALLMLCLAGSVATHAIVLTLLPQWKALRDDLPRPLTVELISPETSPQIVPPKPLPLDVPRERPAPQPLKPAVAQTTEPRAQQDTILMAAPEAPPSSIVVPEQRPAPPADVQRPALAPVAAPAPATPPRSDAAYLNNPRPVYPLAARRRGDQGTVLIRVLVTAEGLAASVGLEKTSGHASLDEAALAAVKAWRFVPARQGAQAIESPYVVPVVFKLD